MMPCNIIIQMTFASFMESRACRWKVEKVFRSLDQG